jgi:hypothetical protein
MRTGPLPLRRTPSVLAALLALALPLAALTSCGDDGRGDGNDGDIGSSCGSPADCYPGLDQAQIQGEVRCIDRVPGGYCSHLCQTDADCCTVNGECDAGHPQVCAPFESTGEMYCFLSCEDAIVDGEDPTVYCNNFASEYFSCRSSGGGSQNRKVCVP